MVVRIRQCCHGLRICLLVLICTFSFGFFAKAELRQPFIDTLSFPITNGSMLGETFNDSRDMLWLSSMGGYLNRYDGANLSSELKTMLFYFEPDAWDRMWSEKIYRDRFNPGYFDLKNGQDYNVEFKDESGKLFDLKQTFSIANNGNQLWLINIQGELYQASLTPKIGKSLIFHKESQTVLKTQTFSTDDRELWLDSLGNVWFTLNDQLLRYSPEQRRWTDFSHAMNPGTRYDWGIFTANTQSATTWLSGYSTNQLLRIDRNDQIKSITLPYRIMDLQADPARNSIWVATTNGLYFVEGEASTLQHYGPEPWQDAGVPSPTIRKLSLDRYHNLWITSGKGIHVMRAMHDNVKRIIPSTRRKHNPLDAGLQVVLHLVKQNDHILWWINRRQELVRYDEHSGQEKIFPIHFGENTLFDEVHRLTLGEPFLLMNTQSGNILRFDLTTERFLPPIPGSQIGGNALNNNTFFSYYPEHTGQLWLTGFSDSTTQDSSMTETVQRQFRYWDIAKRRFESFSCSLENPQLSHLIKSGNLHYLARYRDTLWLLPQSALSNILLKISLLDHTCSNFQLPLEMNLPYALTQRDDNSLWLMHGKQIYRIDINDNRILYQQETPLASVDFANFDNLGNLLIYGDTTLIRFNLEKHSWTTLFTSEINLDIKSGIKPVFDAHSNMFYILNHQGILAVDTQKSLPLDNQRLVYTSIKIGSTTQTLYEHLPKLNIPFGEAVEVSFVAVPLVPSKLLHFRYRLSADQPWVEITNTKLIFTRLPPGVISLEMQAASTGKEFGASEYFTFSVLPPWWRTNWAYTGYFLAGFLLIYLIVSWFRSKERIQSAQLTLSVFDNTSEGLCVLSSDYQVLRINQSMQTMLGWTNGQQVMQQVQAMFPLSKADKIKDIISKQNLSGRWQGETTFVNPEGVALIAEIRVERLNDNDPSGHLLVVAEDITQRKQHENLLFYQSRHDSLTQLPNRLCFSEHLGNLMKSRLEIDRYALILIDLDDFKSINDSLGHKVGDLLLQDVAIDLLALSNSCPAPGENLVARQGGDEFLIIINTYKNRAMHFDDWLLRAVKTLSRQRIIYESTLNISASMGISFLPDNTLDPDMLLQQADMAMYQAKHKKKGKYAFYSSQLDTKLKQRIEIENAILHGLGHYGLEIYYQPKIEINTSKIIGVEALFRWRLASGELLSPEQSLPFIRLGLMDRLFGLAVIKQACQDLLRFQVIMPEIKMSVNVSPKHLEEHDYVHQICAIVDKFEIPHEVIILEILEDAGVSNINVLKNLKMIHECNFRISIDDFGTGYSSLSHLNQLLADELKIDRSF